MNLCSPSTSATTVCVRGSSSLRPLNFDPPQPLILLSLIFGRRRCWGRYFRSSSAPPPLPPLPSSSRLTASKARHGDAPANRGGHRRGDVCYLGWPSTTASVLAYELAAVVSICLRLRLRLARTREMLRGKVKNRGNSLGRGHCGSTCKTSWCWMQTYFFFSSKLPFVSVFMM